MSARCRVRNASLVPGLNAVIIENDLLAATIIIDQGADIHSLVYKPRGLDVLWKNPAGLSLAGRGLPSRLNSQDSWLHTYSGGWQVIFPNGGAANVYKGVEHSFHGEASVAPWDYEVLASGPHAAEVRLSTALTHSPFAIERTLRVEAGRPALLIHEQVTNRGAEALDFMWGHHPAYGAPFLSDACRLDIGARALLADETAHGPTNPLTAGQRYPWPITESDLTVPDLAWVPSQGTPRSLMGYFTDLAAGWYALTNCQLGFGVGLVWPHDIFPYAWFWQEMHATDGFPWYKSAYVMAVEPFTSFPGHGLSAVAQKTGTQRTLTPGQSLAVDLLATFYESTTGVARIERDGTVHRRA